MLHSGGNVTADDGVAGGDLDSSSNTQRISSLRKLAEHFKESLFFSGRSFSLPRIFLLVGKICKHSLFLKCSLYSALVCNNSSTVDVFIFSLLTLTIPGTSPAQQLFVGGFFFFFLSHHLVPFLPVQGIHKPRVVTS